MPTKEQFTMMLWTLGVTFSVAALGVMTGFGTDILSTTSDQWKLVLASGVAAVIKLTYNFLLPTYTAYGVGAKPADPTE